MEDKIKICFDKDYHLRALDPIKFEKGEELEKECTNFIGKISTFNEKVNNLVDILESHANKIDSQKLKAIGLRIAAENEVDQRNRQERALQTMINEKKAELDRYIVQLQSLERIEAEQKSSLEKLSSS